jgi:hypothetical protein
MVEFPDVEMAERSAKPRTLARPALGRLEEDQVEDEVEDEVEDGAESSSKST